MPKKSLTAYAIFVKVKRKEMLKANQAPKTPDMMKELGQMWTDLSVPQRAIYEEFAKRDKVRY